MPSYDSYLNPVYNSFNGSFFPVKPVERYAAGLDLGSSVDHTCLSIVCHRRDPLPEGSEGWIGGDLIQRLGPSRFHVKHLERLKLGLSYVEIADHVLGLMTGSVLRGMPLIADQTGVGKAVIDLLEDRGLTNLYRLTITGGHEERRMDGGRTLHVPKLQLLSHLESALHLKELRVAQGLAEGEAFKNELLNFRVARTETGISLNARNGAHDDIVLSVALSLYFLRKPGNNRWAAQSISL
jgi:hypothetical protein